MQHFTPCQFLSMLHSVSERFYSLCHRLGVHKEQAASVWQLLHFKYAEPHRVYHNMIHISRMLDALDKVAPSNVNVEMAIWFHDSIYDPKRRDNEVLSAKLFEDTLGVFLKRSVVEHVSYLIMSTDHYHQRGSTEDENLLLDIDLMILGTDAEEYDAYCRAIRKEYDYVPDDQFKEGRKAILKELLSRSVYVTPFFAHLEAPARSNMTREISLLSI